MRSDFSSSSLVRLLGAWATMDTPSSGMDFAERLGQWVSAFDAIKLQAAHQSVRGLQERPAAPALQQAAVQALQEQLQRVRAALVHAIAQDPVTLSGADPADPGFAPFQRRHGELQRHMEQMLTVLREQVRRCLADAGGRLQALASLDAAMQDMLAPREQQWLATVPGLLGRRFDQRRQAARQPQLALAGAGDAAPDWLAAFAGEWRQVLRAELDLRLEPVAGLMAALNNELNLSS